MILENDKSDAQTKSLLTNQSKKSPNSSEKVSDQVRSNSQSELKVLTFGADGEEIVPHRFLKRSTKINTNDRPRTSNAKPIVSYGIILFTKNNAATNDPLFLIYQRRDSYEYMDFLRGLWNSERRVAELVTKMTHDERERLTKYTFNELWDDLWMQRGNIYKDGLEKATKKYESIKEELPKILDTPNEEPVFDLQWSFPKGKRDGQEDEVTCALRELGEETTVDTKDVKVCLLRPFSEFYKGNDNKAYCTYYYVAEVSSMLPIKRMSTPNCIRTSSLSEEAADAKWATLEEACLLLNPRRQNILKRVEHIIATKYDQITVKQSNT